MYNVYFQDKLYASFRFISDAYSYLDAKLEDLYCEDFDFILDQISEDHKIDRSFVGILPTSVLNNYRENYISKIKKQFVIKEVEDE